MAETWEALTSRRNVRSYSDRAIAPEHLERILEGARRTPSASNRQHWDLVVVTERQQLADLATVWRGAGHIAASAATVALVAPEPPDERSRLIDQYDLGQLSYAIALVAADLGIGSGHASVGDQDRARRVLGVPEGFVVSWLIALGYPADRPLRPVLAPDRRPLAEIVHHGRW
ncbi:nitroreductase family protein [Kineosporia sp. J2-2]|uniref:Nitroreductase family protein n=1 Tax=Kineosporia corallincola TaxID=2835133 RepID=A0ABS5TAR9_9ACTN|nr:nitroreductase family protein [Kineosporia corallincola]MBT0768170.1 nitroreductase family protein [Kineosporia corallincola]